MKVSAVSFQGRIDQKSVFLVSGGARGITARCVIRMAGQYQCGFILLGRTSVAKPEPEWAAGCGTEAELKKQMVGFYRAEGRVFQPREIQRDCRWILACREVEQTLQAIRRAGGRAVYACADVTNGKELKAGLADVIRQLGSVTGLIHGAGVLADKRIEAKTDADFELVYGAKITGLQNLLSCVAPDRLQHLVLFSSVAAFFGNPGQSDYSLANEILNKAAHLIGRQHPSCRVLALNWGPWDGGMVTPELKHFFEERRIPLIPVAAGTQVLIDALEGEGSVQSVIGGSLPAIEAVRDGTVRKHRIQRALSLEGNPFLLDHVIGGVPVLPTTCAMSWIIHSCESCYPGFGFFASRDFRVLKGIVFDRTFAGFYDLDLAEAATSDPDETVIEARISSSGPGGKTRYHYSATLVLKRRLPAPVVCAFDRSAYPDSAPEIPFYRDGTLFHGPSFQGIRRVLELTRETVVLECEVSEIGERCQGQFQARTFNPFAADIAFQSMVIWVRQTYGAGSLPLACKAGEQYKTVPFEKTFYTTMKVVTATASRLVADITTHDEAGRVYNLISGSEVTIDKHLLELFKQNRFLNETAPIRQ